MARQFCGPALLLSLSAASYAGQCSMDDLAGSGRSWIVFGSFRGGDFSSSVHAVLPDGAGECRLSRHPGGRPGCLDPTVSSDGSTIAFSRGGDGSHRTSVWEMKADGTGERRVTDAVMVRFRNGRAAPAPAPTNRSLLYVTERGGVRSLQLLNTERSSTKDLGPGEFPAWSPDGRWIAFALKDGEGHRLWLVRPDGSDRRPLPTGASSGYPAWSPGGSRIVFSRAVDEGVDLFVIGADGSGLARLTSTPEVAERHPAWSPDGKLIAFTAQPDDAPDGWQRSIYVMPAAGGPARQVTPSRYNDTSPSWLTLSAAPRHE